MENAGLISPKFTEGKCIYKVVSGCVCRCFEVYGVNEGLLALRLVNYPASIAEVLWVGQRFMYNHEWIKWMARRRLCDV